MMGRFKALQLPGNALDTLITRFGGPDKVSQTLHLTPDTLHPTPITSNPPPVTLNPNPSSLDPAPAWHDVTRECIRESSEGWTTSMVNGTPDACAALELLKLLERLELPLTSERSCRV